MPKLFRVFCVFACPPKLQRRLGGSHPHRPRRSLRLCARKSAICLLTAVLCTGMALAAGYSKTYDLSSGTVTVENTQKRTCWHPASLLFRFNQPVSATITVKRQSDDKEYLLSSVTASNAQNVVWAPETDYPFNFGDALIVSTTATNGTLEIIRRGE